MGAQQSSGAAGADGASADAGAIKTSYYELLGIERTATEEEIKKAYRKKALELHPDRNYGDVDRTTALFADVQTAYQVLSDPQERAWYDAHEGDMLRGGDGQGGSDEHYEYNMRVTTADQLARMMGRFRAGIDYSDAPSGFYGFVRDAFEQLAREEQHAADFSGASIPDYPSFGHRDDAYDDVVRNFYAVWTGFATVKSFAWRDKYRPSDAPDRRVRRAIDKENKKLRDDGIREFNDAVRTLVAFVRKRDPRYTPSTQSPEEAAKAQREASKAKAAKARAANAAKWQEQEDAVPEWARAREQDEELEETDEESEEEHFECVACRKTFKSERQYDAHEKSKKHQKAVYALRRKMQKDNAKLNLDDDGVASSGAITPVSADGAAELDDLAEQVHGVDMAEESDGEVENSNEDPDGHPDPPTQRKPRADHNTTASSPQPEPSEETEAHSSSSSSDAEADENDEYAARSTVEARLAPSSSRSPSPSTDSLAPNDNPSTKPAPPQKKVGAAALKRAKRAAKLADDNAGNSTSDAGGSTAELKHVCAKCEARFASKTKLFQHIKERGHVALVSEVRAGGGAKKGKR